MFCTDIFSAVCSGVDANGALLDKDGDPIPGVESLTGNPRLTPDQEKIIAWLIRNGHAFDGEGYYGPLGGFGTEGLALGDTANRLALQVLIWCVSDPPDPASIDPTEHDRYASCEASLDAAEQARILALVPETPVTTLELTDPSGEGVLGEPVLLDLTTNVFDQPILLTLSGTGTLEVVSGPAVITGGQIVVSGTDPDVPVTVRLALTATAVGEVEVSVSTTPTVRTALSWNQSPGDGAPECQVFATFSDFEIPTVADATQIRIVPANTPTDTPTSTPTGGPRVTLAATGGSASAGPLAVVAVTLTLGAALVVLGRREAADR